MHRHRIDVDLILFLFDWQFITNVVWYTKQKTIEVETYKYKRALRKKDNSSSILVPLISSLVVALQISKATVMDMQIYEFFESISRISAKEVADNLCRGLYAGTISMESLNKKELNWMRELR